MWKALMKLFLPLLYILPVCAAEHFDKLRLAVCDPSDDPSIMETVEELEGRDFTNMILVPYDHPEYYKKDSRYAWGQAWALKKPTQEEKTDADAQECNLEKTLHHDFHFRKLLLGIGNLTDEERLLLMTMFEGESPKWKSQYPSTRELEKYLVDKFTYNIAWTPPKEFENRTDCLNVLRALRKIKARKMMSSEYPTMAEYQDFYMKRYYNASPPIQGDNKTPKARFESMWLLKDAVPMFKNYRLIGPTFEELVGFLKERHLFKGFSPLLNLKRIQCFEMEEHYYNAPVYKPDYDKRQCSEDPNLPSKEQFEKYVLDIFYKNSINYDPVGVRHFPVVCSRYRQEIMDFVSSPNYVKATVRSLKSLRFPVLTRLFETERWVVYEVPLYKAKELGVNCNSLRDCRTFSPVPSKEN